MVRICWQGDLLAAQIAKQDDTNAQETSAVFQHYEPRRCLCVSNHAAKETSQFMKTDKQIQQEVLDELGRDPAAIAEVGVTDLVDRLVVSC